MTTAAQTTTAPQTQPLQWQARPFVPGNYVHIVEPIEPGVREVTAYDLATETVWPGFWLGPLPETPAA